MMQIYGVGLSLSSHLFRMQSYRVGLRLSPHLYRMQISKYAQQMQLALLSLVVIRQSELAVPGCVGLDYMVCFSWCQQKAVHQTHSPSQAMFTCLPRELGASVTVVLRPFSKLTVALDSNIIHTAVTVLLSVTHFLRWKKERWLYFVFYNVVGGGGGGCGGGGSQVPLPVLWSFD